MKNPYEKTVLGVGYYGKRIDGTIPSCVNNEGTLSREYIHWSGMIHRCFNKKYMRSNQVMRIVQWMKNY